MGRERTRAWCLLVALAVAPLLQPFVPPARACYLWPDGQVDPCASSPCSHGETCRPTPDGTSFTCTCPKRCARHGDDSDSRPVCGDDGGDYDSTCHLNRAACSRRVKIQIKYIGKCDPCADVSCSAGTVCKLSPRREPQCKCSEQCPLDERAVCASDGKTYRNECIMRVAGCRANKQLRIVAESRCAPAVNPCYGKRCEGGKECFVDRYGRASCQCPQLCEPVMRPVCASDDVSYDNECELRRASCRRGRWNPVRHAGMCGSSLCSGHKCRDNSVCVVKDGKPTCTCPTCTDELKEVCGSDGVTYTNECKLRLEACSKHLPNLYVKYEGVCEGCTEHNCNYFSICVSDGAGGGQCRCPPEADCAFTADPTPVCGTDGRNYANECALQAAACRSKVFVVVASRGKCDQCANVTCPWGSKCVEGECRCPRICPQPADVHDRTVCGSDGKRYPSECHMMLAGCDQGMTIHKQDMKNCPDPNDVGIVPKGITADGRILCLGSKFGCCPDGLTPKTGPGTRDGCAQSECRCNRLGAYSDACDPQSGKCRCRPGVVGDRCDRCATGFWGLKLIANGVDGCQPCGCRAGAARPDCAQDSGTCVCLPGVYGAKCDTCAENFFITNHGCFETAEYAGAPGTCTGFRCLHNGECVMGDTGKPECKCHEKCIHYYQSPEEQLAMEKLTVCGSDGKTYKSMCELKKYACRYQQDIVVIAFGQCDPSESKSRSAQLQHTTMYPYDLQPVEQTTELSTITAELITPEVSKRSSKLGDRCENDRHCAVPFSECNEYQGSSRCVCRRFYVATVDGDCVEFAAMHPVDSVQGGLSPPMSESDPCKPTPCGSGATCRPAAGTFECVCPKGKTGKTCHLDQYPVVYENVNGILLFSGSSKGVKGDFIALSLIDGYLQFRYNVGNGPVTIQSASPIPLHKWRRATATLSGKRGRLSVDGQPAVHAPDQLHGGGRQLNLDGPVLIGWGGQGRHAGDLSGTSEGLRGCVRAVRLDDYLIDLRVSVSSDIRRWRDVGACGADPCASLPCQFDGMCKRVDDRMFECVCPPGYHGELCERRACEVSPCERGGTCVRTASVDGYKCICPAGALGRHCQFGATTAGRAVMSPLLQQDDWLRVRYDAADALDALSVTLTLQLHSDNQSGIVFHLGGSDATSDYATLFLSHNVPVFQFDLGSGPLTLWTGIPLPADQWIELTAERIGRNATLRVDGVALAQDVAPGSLAQLNAAGDTSLWLGAPPDDMSAPPLAAPHMGVAAAVQRVQINAHVVEDLFASSTLASPTITRHGFACVGTLPSEPAHTATLLPRCEHNGLCVPHGPGYRCRCVPPWVGERCRTEGGVVAAVHFDGNTLLQFNNRVLSRATAERNSSYTFRIKATKPPSSGGSVLLHQGAVVGAGDYLSLQFGSGGTVTLAFDLGAGECRAESRVSLLDGKWHGVAVNRVERHGALSVDGAVVECDAPPGASQLDTNGYVLIGGLSSGLGSLTSACLSDLTVSGVPASLTHHNVHTLDRPLRFCDGDYEIS